MFSELRPDVLNPPAIIVQAFNEERALTEIRAQIGRRDDAKGEYKSAILVIGQKLIEARRAMPGATSRNGERYSPGFLAFIEKTGLKTNTAMMYMSWARNPKQLEKYRVTASAKAKAEGGSRVQARRKALVEMLDMLKQAADLDAAIEAVQLEINELKPTS